MNKPICKAHGILAPGALCGSVIVGMKYCGFTGVCEHKSMAAITANSLPTPKEGQLWCCSKGCGDCKPREAKHEYYRHEDFEGNLVESKTETIYVSHCCQADLLLWDEGKQDFVDWSYTKGGAAATVPDVPVQYACDRTGMLMPVRCGDCLCWSQPALAAVEDDGEAA